MYRVRFKHSGKIRSANSTQIVIHKNQIRTEGLHHFGQLFHPLASCHGINVISPSPQDQIADKQVIMIIVNQQYSL